MKHSKKSQIKMTETFAIMFIFFILIIISVSFFAKFQKINIEKAESERTDLRSIEAAQKVSSLPELQCSTKDIVSEACFDILKLEAFNELLSNNPKYKGDYYDIFGYSNITVRKVYPCTDPDNCETWKLYSNPGNGTSLFAPIPILLFDAVDSTFSFGVLEVKYYASS